MLHTVCEYRVILYLTLIISHLIISHFNNITLALLFIFIISVSLWRCHVWGINSLFQSRIPLFNPRTRTHNPRQSLQFLASSVLNSALISFSPGALVEIDVVLPAGAGLIGVGETGIEGGGCQQTRVGVTCPGFLGTFQFINSRPNYTLIEEKK